VKATISKNDQDDSGVALKDKTIQKPKTAKSGVKPEEKQ